MDRLEVAREYKRNNADFPLTVHASGQWCKKICGRQFYFGVLDDPAAARKRYEYEAPYLEQGYNPPPLASGHYDTLGELLDQFVEDAKRRREANELSANYCGELIQAAEMIRNTLDETYDVNALRPTHFAKLRDAIARTGRNLRSQKNMIVNCRSVFRWMVEMELCKPLSVGPRFKPPTTNAIERERATAGKCRWFDREIVLTLINAADVKMRAMILLGVNCGLQAGDLTALPAARLHLTASPPYHDFPRVKNGRRRMGVLWPVTVKALRASLGRSKLAFPRPRDLSPNDRAHEKSISDKFNVLCKSANVARPSGAGFGSLRHTLGTMLDLVPDEQIRALIMGHTPKTMQARIYSQLNLGEIDRLKRAADIVHDYLFKGKIP